VGDLVDLERYRSSQAPAEPRTARPEPLLPDRDTTPADPAPVLAGPQPERFGWVVIQRDAQADPVRWFHPGRVMQLGYVPSDHGWVYLDDAHQVRAWSTLTPGQVAEALSRGVLPAAELASPHPG
jgi:hypothetical protein